MKKNYTLTVSACYVGYIVQAIVNNLSPLLFVQFGRQFGISAFQLSLVVFINFGIQILVDSQSAKIALKVGYRASAVVSQVLCVTGLMCLSILPNVINPFVGILLSTLFTAVGGGFIEVVLSPVLEALPLKNKSGAMCLLHSFYCWGHLIVILASTLYFKLFSVQNWAFLPLIFAAVPIVDCFLFAKCPFEKLGGDIDPVTYKTIFKMKYFILFFVLMIAAGAAEQAIAQWASYFAEVGLQLPSKEVGDLFGGALFALGMALSRTAYGFIGDKINLKAAISICGVGLLGSYLLASLSPFSALSLAGIGLGGVFVGIMWPGIYSLAGKNYPRGGTKMFGMLALAGDVGCTLGPVMVGVISSDIKIGLLVSAIFPFVIVFIMAVLLKSSSKRSG